MDRPAYELVSLLEALLDDCDQMPDSPEDPNNVRIWAVRAVLEDFGGSAHRWTPQRCDECAHVFSFHHAGPGCAMCDCTLSKSEALGGRDVTVDDSIARALRENGA